MSYSVWTHLCERMSQTLMHLSMPHEKSSMPSSLIATCCTDAVCPIKSTSGFGERTVL